MMEDGPDGFRFDLNRLTRKRLQRRIIRPKDDSIYDKMFL